jgi:hypothetical protein
MYILMLLKIFVDDPSSSYASNMFTLQGGIEKRRREERREEKRREEKRREEKRREEKRREERS